VQIDRSPRMGYLTTRHAHETKNQRTSRQAGEISHEVEDVKRHFRLVRSY
jgi:hypothetical protein